MATIKVTFSCLTLFLAVIPQTQRLFAQKAEIRALASAAQISGGWPDPMLSQINIVTRHDSGTVLAPVWNR